LGRIVPKEDPCTGLGSAPARFTTTFGRPALESGRDWWSQIEEVLKSKALEHFVLLVTPEALEIDASQSGEGSARS
jgi:hypothetical protein